MSCFRDILDRHQEFFLKYLVEISEIGLVILDESFIITECNNGFYKNLGFAGKPIGEELFKLLKMDVPKWKLTNTGKWHHTNLNFTTTKGLPININCCLYTIDSGYILFTEIVPLVNEELVSKMSQINNELSNLTRELTKKTIDLENSNATIKKLTNTDALTKLYNRRYMEEILPTLIENSKNQKSNFVIIMADIDHFKNINDLYGHDTGDKILRIFSKIIRNSCKEQDFVFRFGGEEFLVALPNTNKNDASMVAESIRHSLESLKLQGIKNSITVSLGVAEFSEKDTLKQLIKKADSALYEAKNTGRNRVVIA